MSSPSQLPALPRALCSLVLPSKHRSCFTQNPFARLIREKTELTQNCKSGLGSKLRQAMPLSPLFTHWLISCFCSEMKINTPEGQFSGMGLVVSTGLSAAGENTSWGWQGPHLLTPNSLHQQFCLKTSPWMMSLISGPPLSLSQPQFSPFHPSGSVPTPPEGAKQTACVGLGCWG